MAKMVKRRARRHFTAEYKREAVNLARASDKSITEVAKELDLTVTCLRAWMKQADIDDKASKGTASGALTTAERAELARLRRELKQVTQERDVLKKATAFFARTST